MKLVYKHSNKLVKLKDEVTLRDGTKAKVHYFREPHKPSSEGKVSILAEGTTREYFVSIIGAEWIEREDR